MTVFFKKALFILHLVFSIGWLGAVAAFFVLAVLGYTGEDETTVRSAYISMQAITTYAIVPASIGALITGIIQTATNQWGLWKQYWIIFKLLFTIAATILLILHLNPINKLYWAAFESIIAVEELKEIQWQLILDSFAAIILLLTITTVSVYKPWGKVKAFSAFKMIRFSSPKKTVLFLVLFMAFFAVILLHVLGYGPKH
jgi:hypothetical protein